ncbi:hypothetical protein BSNK01_09270 [Bacillaceae bacterium]
MITVNLPLRSLLICTFITIIAACIYLFVISVKQIGFLEEVSAARALWEEWKALEREAAQVASTVKSSIEEDLKEDLAAIKEKIFPGEALPVRFLLDVPVVRQFPEFHNGCEIASLAMLTQYVGLPYGKQELAGMVPKDPTPLRRDSRGRIIQWGDPNAGFVGDITGKNPGYAIYHKALARFLDSLYDGKAKDLTGSDFEDVLKEIVKGKPVIVWTTIDFTPTGEWLEWQTKDGRTIRATFKEHAVLLVGFDENFVYVNNPYNGQKAQKIEKESFVKSWEQLGRQAVTIAGVED